MENVLIEGETEKDLKIEMFLQFLDVIPFFTSSGG